MKDERTIIFRTKIETIWETYESAVFVNFANVNLSTVTPILVTTASVNSASVGLDGLHGYSNHQFSISFSPPHHQHQISSDLWSWGYIHNDFLYLTSGMGCRMLLSEV